MKRKIIAGILCAALILMAGCGGKGPRYAKGTVTETSFESEFIGLKFTVPEGYEMKSEEDLLELMAMSGEIIFENMNKETFDYAMAASVQEMMVSAPDGLPNVSVIVEKLPNALKTTERYIDATIELMEGLDSISFSFGEVTTVDFAGKRYHKLSAVSTFYGMEMLQEWLLLKIGDRMVTITITYSADTIDEMQMMMGHFSALA
ncbi:MAG: hypothetical protein FWE69_08165 [Clostridiales bacterium]|nr:hypothetical protein [Clostridiales bacterium]